MSSPIVTILLAEMLASISEQRRARDQRERIAHKRERRTEQQARLHDGARRGRVVAVVGDLRERCAQVLGDARPAAGPRRAKLHERQREQLRHAPARLLNRRVDEREISADGLGRVGRLLHLVVAQPPQQRACRLHTLRLRPSRWAGLDANRTQIARLGLLTNDVVHEIDRVRIVVHCLSARTWRLALLTRGIESARQAREIEFVSQHAWKRMVLRRAIDAMSIR